MYPEFVIVRQALSEGFFSFYCLFNFEMTFCGQRIKFIEFVQELDVLFPILFPHSLPREIQVLRKKSRLFSALRYYHCHLAVPTGSLIKPKVYPVLMCKGQWGCERRPFFLPHDAKRFAFVFSQSSRIERASKGYFGLSRPHT